MRVNLDLLRSVLHRELVSTCVPELVNLSCILAKAQLFETE